MQFNQGTLLPTYDQRPPVRPVTLTFTAPDMEADFHRFYIGRSIGFVRIVMLLAVFLYMIFGVLDYYNLNNSMFEIMVTRITVSASILGCIGFNKLYMSFAIARIQQMEFSIAGAGMPPGYLYRYKTGIVEKIELKGFPLGSPADFPYFEQRYKLARGDTLMLLTDGLPELFNPDKSMFGYDKIEQIFNKHATLKPRVIIEQFKQAIDDWLQDTQQNDDITFLILQRKRSHR